MVQTGDLDFMGLGWGRHGCLSKSSPRDSGAQGWCTPIPETQGPITTIYSYTENIKKTDKQQTLKISTLFQMDFVLCKWFSNKHLKENLILRPMFKKKDKITK